MQAVEFNNAAIQSAPCFALIWVKVIVLAIAIVRQVRRGDAIVG
jgi:hypothetical protein